MEEIVQIVGNVISISAFVRLAIVEKIKRIKEKREEIL